MASLVWVAAALARPAPLGHSHGDAHLAPSPLAIDSSWAEPVGTRAAAPEAAPPASRGGLLPDDPARSPWGDPPWRPTLSSPVLVGRPLFGDPETQHALRDLRRRRFAPARARFVARQAEATGDAAAALGYLVARCDAGLGWRPEAEAGFEMAARSLPALAPQILADRLAMAGAAGDDEAALALLAALPPEDPGFVDLSIRQARRLRGEDRHAEALVVLERAAPHTFWPWNRARVALWSAEAHRAIGGDAAAWHQGLRGVWHDYPRTEARDDARAALQVALDDVRGPAPMTVDEVVAAASEDAGAGRSGAVRGWLHGLQRRNAKAARELEALTRILGYPKTWGRRVAKECKAALGTFKVGAVRDRLLLALARGERRQARYGPALAAYDRAGTLGADVAIRATALFEGGRLARKMRRAPEARALFEAYLALPDGAPADERARVLWEIAWLDWLDGRLAAADARLAVLIDLYPAALDTSKRTFYERALYWRARIAARQGRRDEALRGWRFVMRRFPLSYYAVLARQWLARSGVDPGPLVLGADRHGSPSLPWKTGPLPAQTATAAALYRVGLLDEARAHLRRLFDLGRLRPPGVRLLSSLYRERGDAWRSHWIVQAADPLDVDPGGAMSRDRWLAAFPTPFTEIVEREAEEHGVDPLLIWAVMRQESAFRVRARSVAKALGLMQVLYPTAKLVARKLLKERAPTLEYVLTKRGNVHYGTAYLKHLIDRFDGNLALAIAGYNAGPGGPLSWLEQVGHLETDEFVEEIPYEETRGYTRKVLRSYAAYRALYGPVDLVDPWVLPRALPGRERPVARADEEVGEKGI
mgnify:CR=1 FL=1